MRNGLLAFLGVLAAGAGAATAQPAPDAPPATVPAQAIPPAVQPAQQPAPQFGQPWDRSWERVIWSAGGPPAAPAPAQPQPAACPEPPKPPADTFWFSADYLVWWTKNGPLPTPLVTTGPAGADVIGGLGAPGTRLLFGGVAQDYGTSNGFRLDTGVWLDDGHHWGLEAGFFMLEQRAVGFGARSDTAGNPVLAQPLINATTGQAFTEVVALPGLLTGGVAIATHSRLQGWEINGLANVVRGDGFSFDVLAGFRTAKLDEDLQVATEFSPLASDFLTFRGAAVNPGSTVATTDLFQAQNQFYGLQLGGRAEWTFGSLGVSALGKVALGGSQELVRVVGESALYTPGAAAVTAPGGVLAVGPTVGRHFRDQFAVLPEFGIELSYRLNRNVEAHFGYSFLYWSGVARPGNQVSRSVEPALIPTDPGFSAGATAPPVYQVHGSSDYWAQGLNFGAELHF